MNADEAGFRWYVRRVAGSAPLWLACVSGCSVLLGLAGIAARAMKGTVRDVLIEAASTALFALVVACGLVGAHQRRLWLTLVGTIFIFAVPQAAMVAWYTLTHRPVRIGAGVWGMVIMACIMISTAAHGLAVQARRWRPRKNTDAPSCEKCGYNLIGNTSGRCPECGTPTPTPPNP